MTKTVKTMMVVAALGAATVGVMKWKSSAPSVEPAHNAQLVQDRLWIDHMPSNDRDKFHLFAVIAKHRFGLFDQRSRWVGEFEGFRYEAHKDEMRLVYPQTGDKETIKVDAKKCDARGFDYCLEVSGSSRGAKRYYSRKDWVIKSADDATALADTLVK